MYTSVQTKLSAAMYSGPEPGNCLMGHKVSSDVTLGDSSQVDCECLILQFSVIEEMTCRCFRLWTDSVITFTRESQVLGLSRNFPLACSPRGSQLSFLIFKICPPPSFIFKGVRNFGKKSLVAICQQALDTAVFYLWQSQ